MLSVNDGSSLVGVDLDTGDASWTFRAQWLYTVLDELHLGAPVRTAPLIVGTRVFVLKWPNDRSAPALVALEA